MTSRMQVAPRYWSGQSQPKITAPGSVVTLYQDYLERIG